MTKDTLAIPQIDAFFVSRTCTTCSQPSQMIFSSTRSSTARITMMTPRRIHGHEGSPRALDSEPSACRLRFKGGCAPTRETAGHFFLGETSLPVPLLARSAWHTDHPEVLRQVNVAEAALRNIGFSNFRVRYHHDLARIEFLQSDIADAISRDRAEIVSALKLAGFRHVTIDLEGYRDPSPAR